MNMTETLTRFKPTGWYWVNLPYASYGIEVDDNDVVVKAAPIAHWMVGKTRQRATAWITNKGGVIIEVVDS